MSLISRRGLLTSAAAIGAYAALPADPAAAAISVTSIGAVNNTSGATLTLATSSIPSGALIIAAVTDGSNASPAGAVSDAVNGSYTAGPGVNCNGLTSNGFAALFYFVNSASVSSFGTTITYTKAVSGSLCALSVAYATGIATSSPYDSAVAATAYGNSNISLSSVTSGTPAVSGELFIGVAGGSPGFSNFSVYSPAGWSLPPNDSSARSGSTYAEVIGGYQVNSGTGTKTFSGNEQGTTTNWGVMIAGFKALVAASVAHPILMGPF